MSRIIAFVVLEMMLATLSHAAPVQEGKLQLPPFSRLQLENGMRFLSSVSTSSSKGARLEIHKVKKDWSH
jgi:hypothetical protein